MVDDCKWDVTGEGVQFVMKDYPDAVPPLEEFFFDESVGERRSLVPCRSRDRRNLDPCAPPAAAEKSEMCNTDLGEVMYRLKIPKANFASLFGNKWNKRRNPFKCFEYSIPVDWDNVERRNLASTVSPFPFDPILGYTIGERINNHSTPRSSSP